MKNTANIFKSKVMKAAWTSLKSNRSSSLSEALKSAWVWAKKTLSHSTKVVTATIEKTTGKAYLLGLDFGKNVWVPKSAVEQIQQYLDGSTSYFNFVIASWVKF